MAAQEKPIEEVLSFPIILSDRILQLADDAHSFKLECSQVRKQSERLAQMLRSVVRFATSVGSLYEPPIRRISADVTKNLDKALTLVRKCKRRSVLRRVVSIVSAADFRKVFNLLDASIGDMIWLLSICDYGANCGGGIILSLPPIASNDPILSWVWSFIASIHLGQLSDRIEAANELASIAKDNYRNQQIIVEEGGIPPLLKLLKETASMEAQIASASALFNLANDQNRVRTIGNELGLPIIVHVLGNSPMRVQIAVANLVGRMAEYDSIVQEDFARENVIRPLVTLLSFETFVDLPQKRQFAEQSFHSVVQINKEMGKNPLMSFNYRPSTSSWLNSVGWAGVHGRRERENETPEMKVKLKLSCAKALWMLARGSVPNSRRITETKGLLCLAKLIETEQEELQFNCLMTLMEITAAAESNADLRRAAFKTNSPAAKAVVDQLLKLVRESNNPSLQIPAMRSIGSLARTFPARQIQVVVPIVEQLSDRNQDVSTEAAICLRKFACPDNFLCVEHTKTIFEFSGVNPLMKLLRGDERAQLHGLFLLCYLALYVGNGEVSEHGRMLTALEGADRSVTAQHPGLRELISSAIYHLHVYHAVGLPQTQSYAS